MGFNAWQLYTALSESNSSSVLPVYQPYLKLEPQFPNPNHKTSGSFSVFFFWGGGGGGGGIQCSAKRVYAPKDFRYRLLTKNRHQYLKERVFKNFAVRLRKSLILENC